MIRPEVADVLGPFLVCSDRQSLEFVPREEYASQHSKSVTPERQNGVLIGNSTWGYLQFKTKAILELTRDLFPHTYGQLRIR